MKNLKTFNEFLNEAKKPKSGSDIVKYFKQNKDDWGDTYEHVYTKGKNFVYIDGFFYGGDDAMNRIVKSWSPGGDYYKYLEKDLGVKFEIVDSFTEIKARGRHKKLTDDGIVGLEIKVIPAKINEGITFKPEYGKDIDVDRINFTYTDRGRYYATYVFSKSEKGPLGGDRQVKIRDTKEVEKLLKKIGVNAKIPMRADGSLDDICKKVERKGIECDWNDAFDPS